MTDTQSCPWCGQTDVLDTLEGRRHRHYAVLVRENGRLLGRLTPDGHAAPRKIHAAVYSKDHADYVADQINSRGEFTATVIPF